MVRKLALFILFIGLSTLIKGQSRVLTIQEYMDQVLAHHPVLYQSDLLRERAFAQKRIARGGFDPKLEADWDQKRFDDKNYYRISGGKLKIPTWFGMDVEAGYEQTRGEFLDASDFLPDRGLWNAGISVPLGRGLVIDARRAELKQANILIEMTEQERRLMRNDILFEALETYIMWQQAELFLEIAEEGVTLAQTRLEAVKSSFEEGDKPAIDTLEALISLRVRETEFMKAEQAVENIRVSISNFMWVDGFIPLELEKDVQVETLSLERYDRGVNTIRLRREAVLNEHPSLQLVDFKLDQLEVDRKLAREDLKPDLRVEYKPLLNVGDNSLVGNFDPSDYKIGFSFNYPIIQRKERGKIDLIDVKRKETEIDFAIKRQLIVTKMQNLEINIEQTVNQRNLFTEMVDDYARLLSAERRKFDIGESSIFLINTREVKYLESRYKSVEASVKVLVNRIKYFYVLGVLEDYMNE